eukprot:745482-Rhodomonas_salina.1
MLKFVTNLVSPLTALRAPYAHPTRSPVLASRLVLPPYARCPEGEREGEKEEEGKEKGGGWRRWVLGDK